MKSFYLKCRTDTENINPGASNTSNGKTVILSKYALCGSKPSRLLSNLGLKTPLSKVPILGDVFF